MISIIDDYIDIDVSYFLGLLIARGSIIDKPDLKQIILEFPFSSLTLEGYDLKYNQEDLIRLGLEKIRERLLELFETDISIIPKQNSIDIVIKFLRSNLIWRDILLLTNKKVDYNNFEIPKVFFDKNLPNECKIEFLKGFADVAGNIRKSNRYIDSTNRVRLDILNSKNNWNFPVQLCSLIQDQLKIPVQQITWGHPNLGRSFREHQLNVFAVPFRSIGFSFKHKQNILEELAEQDSIRNPNKNYSFCPDRTFRGKSKPIDNEENNEEKLPSILLGKHFNNYWGICKKLGCKRCKNLKAS